jgi:DNA-binding FadR family transcriptional regulator
MARATLQDDLLNELGSRIVRGLYPTGQLLVTDQLESEFDISRTVVRETLKVLESMRLVQLRRALGIVVLPTERWNVFDPRVIGWRLSTDARTEQLRTLTELRAAIEPSAARSAARFATVEQRAELVEIAHRLTTLAESQGNDQQIADFLLTDVAFHRLLLHSSGNEMFAALDEVVEQVLRGYESGPHGHSAVPPGKGPRLHVEVAEAVAAGDAARAGERMREIFADIDARLEEQ